ncbi:MULTISPECIES: DUF3164 family protein [Leeuwenhoekiella]|uniref:DUF3164 family protein n=1 Tax=Leeuwenhoekiella TaxID=283735 RepID=UPI000C682A57|nr:MULTISPECIES: DUF3164 family protein [Leeuwenhoekiella]MAO42133.1 hypothetical protein [Leeuwenhoekiella sp.]|tara:strand:+ start:113 stop:763 length:651 start_codon:yes stop_codon:yes gene_type:complete
MNTTQDTTAELTEEQLEAKLKELRTKKAKAAEREKKEYERKRDETINFLTSFAQQVHEQLVELKKLCHERMEEQAERLANYGKMPGNSKGGFSITNEAGDYRITRHRDTKPSWDERSVKAQELIKEFLTETVKKRDLKLYEILISFIQRNENGDLEYARVMNLLQHADKYDDPRWVEGLRLIKESYSNHLRGFGYSIKKKDASGKWELINLQFASI